MDKNTTILVVAIVAIVAIGAVAAVVMTGGGSGEKKSDAVGRLQVYGNADNDDYLDGDDMDLIKSIADGKTKWDKKKNPYADANADGAVNSKDVEHFQKILDGKSCLMYYTDFYGDVDYVHYPVTGNIGVNYVYGLQVGQTLGFYDRITAAISSVINNYDEEFYPGLKEMDDIGSDSDAAVFVDNVLAADVSCVLGFYDFNKNLKEAFHASTVPIDLINLPYARCGAGNPVDAIITTGALMGCLDEAREYAAFYDDTMEYIEGKTSELPAGNKAVLLFNPNDYSTVGVDTYGADGSQLGDAWVVFNLPLIDDADHSKSAYVTMQIESRNITDADYLIVVFGTSALSYDTTIAEGYKVFEQKLEFLKGTKAYQNKHIVGVGFVPIGTYLGISELPLMANAIWGDVFDEEYGYEMLEEFYTKFTHVPAGYDFENSGYYHVYSMSRGEKQGPLRGPRLNHLINYAWRGSERGKYV